MFRLLLPVVAFLCLTACITSSAQHCVVSYNNFRFEASKEPSVQQGRLIIDTLGGKITFTLKPTDSVQTTCLP